MEDCFLVKHLMMDLEAITLLSLKFNFHWILLKVGVSVI